MTGKQTLYLIDGSSYIYRAYYAIRHLSSPKGFPTNALYGFTQMLLKVIKDRRPDHIAVVFDVGRTTFRTDLYPDYKANRSAMPDDLVPQIAPIKEMVRAFNIPVLELAGYEADDIIGTIARECEERGMEAVVVTGDKDLMQIVSERVTLLDTMKEKASGIPDVQERFGVGPEGVIDILGLAGDTSDNIPGVPGIGEKTAIKLIQEFGSLDTLLERAGEVKGKTGEKLREFADQARLSRQLATIVRDVPMAFDFAAFAASSPDNRRLAELIKEYGFTTLMKELTSEATLSTEQYRTVATEEEFEALLADLKAAGTFAVDLETTSLNPLEAEIVGISLSYRDHEACYIPVGHFYLGAPEQLPRRRVLDALTPLLIDPKIRKVGQNLKYDYQVFRRHGIELGGVWCDTMVASYLLNPVRSGHGLDSLAVEHLDHKMISYEEVAGKGKEQVNFAQVPVEKASTYSCEDSDAAWLLHRLFLPRVAVWGMERLFFDVEMPLVPILAEMELAGVKLDLPLLGELSAGFGKQLAELEGRITGLAPEPFNLNSPKQLGEVLFEKLKLPTGKKTKTKTGWSTNVEELERLAEAGHEIAALILQYRGLAKLKSTYTDALPKLVQPATGRVHTSYNQTVTNTGRLSSSEPNLQNIPVRTEEGRRIRRAFIAEEGHLLLSADYSQIELRVLAHFSEDRVFCDAFAKDEDIHTRTAAEVFGLFPEMVTPEMRRQAKAINFGVIYGQGAFSLAKQLGIATKVAREFIDNYFARHPGARAFLDGCVREAEEKGHVTTLLGRRLPIPDIKSANGNIRAFAQRNAVNYPIQGSAADIIKEAMVKVTARMRRDVVGSRLIMQVHDELVFEVPKGEVVAMEQLVRREMEHAVSLRVPLKVDINHGGNWSEAH
ncbi:DNA polymerase I [Geobacter metallireducens RCH3]|uniref:DNA polymerase I n=1 Tax=Geobacter metallireducens (strain ATCC 53774 / DSM 7210 / GS-15) TaxID=269799 RepID=Q39RC6_GEOMG|nr:DNA polymerase I [Geobacter metallireducens]ABB33198.1 DNA polymerase I [Geobacter metallireducens GS-15]EHP84411.1 DNA polymerase I [Geobacter metallireducens RCH3]